MTRRRRLGLLASVVAASLVAASPVQARPELQLSRSHAKAGGTVTATVHARAGTACVLSARRGRAVQRTARARLRSDSGFWRLRLTRRAAGTWRLHVTCQGDPGVGRRRLVVSGRGGGPLFSDPVVSPGDAASPRRSTGTDAP